MKIEKYDKLVEKAEKDTTIPDNIKIKDLYDLCLSTTSKYQYWLRIYTFTFHEYEELALEVEKLEGEELKEIKFGNSDKSKYRWASKGEMESQYLQNPILYNKKAELALLKTQCLYLEKTLDNIKSMSFQLKNILEIRKLESML